MSKKYLLLLSLSTLGCVSFQSPARFSNSIENEKARYHHVVMVIDEGIDPEHKAYRDKVIASYTLECHAPPFEDRMYPQWNAQFKQAFLAQLDRSQVLLADRVCRLKKGIEHEQPKVPADLVPLREEWNAHIKNRELMQDKFGKLAHYLDNTAAEYHGTTVAAVLAYKNPNVSLVLVEVKLPKLVNGTCDNIKTKSDFLTQAMNDRDVQERFFAKARLSEWSLIDALAKQYRVSMINKSFSFDIANTLHISHKCSQNANISVLAYLTLNQMFIDRVAQRMGVFYDQEPFLTLQAAGNSGLEIRNQVENAHCVASERHILIGSYQLDGSISPFSNRGRCVGLYALGSNIITSRPDGFLMVTHGTSYATPLAARYISFHVSESLSPQQMRSALTSQLDNRAFIPASPAFNYAAFDRKPNRRLFNPTLSDEIRK